MNILNKTRLILKYESDSEAVKMNVPMFDLKEQYLNIKKEINEALEMVMLNAHYILGPNVKKIEQDVAAYCNVKHGVGVANGSDAIHIALEACGVGAGDEVIVPSFTFFATAGAVARAGATPVFVDIDPKTFNIDPNKIEDAVTKKTKAIIPVHLYGQMADMDPINKIAKKYGLFVIEDAAQAIGAEYKGKRAGELGTATTFSFFPTKNLGAYGDAGMIVTDNAELAEKMTMFRTHGSKPKYFHHVLGYNSRLDELQAAILNVKFRYLEEWTRKRCEKAMNYTQLINEELGEKIVTPFISNDCSHIFHQYTIRVQKRDELHQFLKESGIETIVYYPMPLHLQPVFKDLGYKEGDLPETEKAAKEATSLPMFPELTEEEQYYVVSKLKEFYHKN